jgi:hypothetical protein
MSMVEQPWFAEFMKVVDGKYKVPTRYKVNTSVARKYNDIQAVLQSKLNDAKHVSLTLDLWSDRRMRSFMGITVHFMNHVMELQSYLLDFDYFSGSHTAENIADHCKKVIEKFNLQHKVLFLITDNAANMLKAFRDISQILGEVTHDETETGMSQIEDEEEQNGAGLEDDEIEVMDVNVVTDRTDSSATDESVDLEESLGEMSECGSEAIEQLTTYIGSIMKKRLPCSIHTLQLVVLDGLKNAKFMGNIQSKCSRLSTVLHTSGLFQENYFKVFKTTIPKTNSTRWNSMFLQLSATAKLDPIRLQKLLTDTKNTTCIFTKREFELLQEVVSVLEPAYDATIMMEEEKAMISLVAPTVVELHKKWSQWLDNAMYSDTLVIGLLKSLEKRFRGLLINVDILPPLKSAAGEVVDTATLEFGDPSYLVAAALDPELKLTWLGDKETTKITITGM